MTTVKQVKQKVSINEIDCVDVAKLIFLKIINSRKGKNKKERKSKKKQKHNFMSSMSQSVASLINANQVTLLPR